MSDFKKYDLKNKTFYHGSRTLLPFQSFDAKLDGTGIVSVGNKRYGGFFFTDDKRASEFFTEYFIVHVKISNIDFSFAQETHPPTVLQYAIKNKKNYILEDVVDGNMHSNVVVVPHSNLKDVKVVFWEFIGDEASYFESLDRLFEDHHYDNIIETLETIGMDVNYIGNIPIFKKYLITKRR